MKKLLHVLVLLAALLGTMAEAGDGRALPRVTLADPRGTTHRLDGLVSEGRPLILVVTAPIAALESSQRAWDTTLAAARPKDASAQVVFLEDLSQSWFKGIARDGMKSEFDPRRGPLVLVDEEGQARRALRVAEGATVVLVFDGHGRSTGVHEEAPTAAAAARAWQQASP